MKSGQRFLVGVIWLAPLIALPIYVLSFIDAGLSPSAPNLNPVDIVRLVVFPLVSLITFIAILVRKNFTPRLIAVVALPVLLSLAELISVFLF